MASDSITLDRALALRLAETAEAQGRSTDQVAAEAIETFLDWDDDFRSAVVRGVAEADAGAFATDAEVLRAFRKRV